jgi:hypothetical protein
MVKLGTVKYCPFASLDNFELAAEVCANSTAYEPLHGPFVCATGAVVEMPRDPSFPDTSASMFPLLKG